MEPEHPFVIARLAGVFLCALPAVRELYQYINDPRCDRSLSWQEREILTIPRTTGEQSGWGSTSGCSWQRLALSF
jgi:hypothetical protein